MIRKTGRSVKPVRRDDDHHIHFSSFFLGRVLLSSGTQDYITAYQDDRNKIFIEAMDLIP
jgi:hypothetical protein